MRVYAIDQPVPPHVAVPAGPVIVIDIAFPPGAADGIQKPHVSFPAGMLNVPANVAPVLLIPNAVAVPLDVME